MKSTYEVRICFFALLGSALLLVGMLMFHMMHSDEEPSAKALRKVANGFKQQMQGKMIDSITQFRDAWYSAPATLNYSYTIISSVAEGKLTHMLSRKNGTEKQRAFLLGNYCEGLREIATTTPPSAQYWYFGKSSQLIGTIIFKPGDCTGVKDLKTATLQ